MWQRGWTHRPTPHLRTGTREAPALSGARTAQRQAAQRQAAGRGECPLRNTRAPTKTVTTTTWRRSPKGCHPSRGEGTRAGSVRAGPQDTARRRGSAVPRPTTGQGHDTSGAETMLLSVKSPAHSYRSSYCTRLLYKNSALKIGSAEPPSTFKPLSNGCRKMGETWLWQPLKTSGQETE